MAEYRPEKLDLSLADVIPLRSARRRGRSLLASRPNRNTEYVESRIFGGILLDLFEDNDLVSEYVGDPLLLSRSENKDATLARVAEETQDGVTRYTVIVSPDEYEWLTTNLEFSDWEGTESGLDPESLLGRYYRLTLATHYIVESRGRADLSDPVFQDEVSLGSGRVMCLSPITEYASSARKDTARLRFAGAMVLHGMALSEQDDSELRGYLRYSVLDRIEYALRMLEASEQRGWTLPPDLDRDIQHWLGVCLPIDGANINPADIWKPGFPEVV